MPEVSRTCAHCGATFTPTATQIAGGYGKFCRAECYHVASRRSERVTVTCVCGTQFEVSANKLAAGRGKFCSRKCRYANAARRSGLTYQIKVQNQGWFQEGHEAPSGPASPGWRGDKVGYQPLHRWVAANKTKPAQCEHCGESGRPLQWANKSREYHRDLDDWIALCKPCHGRYDSGRWRGMAVAKYGRESMQGRKRK